METLKKVQVEPSKMEIVNNVITQRTIDEIKEDDFYYLLEGVVATGYDWFITRIRLSPSIHL